MDSLDIGARRANPASSANGGCGALWQMLMQPSCRCDPSRMFRPHLWPTGAHATTFGGWLIRSRRGATCPPQGFASDLAANAIHRSVLLARISTRIPVTGMARCEGTRNCLRGPLGEPGWRRAFRVRALSKWARPLLRHDAAHREHPPTDTRLAEATRRTLRVDLQAPSTMAQTIESELACSARPPTISSLCLRCLSCHTLDETSHLQVEVTR